MVRPRMLRVGICTCSSRYRGRLAGTVLEACGQSFRIVEVPIPEEEPHKKALKSRACHFFVDVHWFTDSVQVTVEKTDWDPDGFSVGWTLAPGDPLWRLGIHTWRRRRSPPVSTVCHGMVRLLRSLGADGVRAWLRRMRRLARRKRRQRLGSAWSG